MRKGKYLLLFCFVLLACAFTAGLIRNGARGQEAPEDRNLEERVTSVIREMGEGREAVWRAGRKLEALGLGAVPPLLTVWKGLPARPQAAVGWALSRLGHKAEVLEHTLLRFKAEEDIETRVLLANLLGSVARGVDSARIEALLDGVFEPRVKVPLCRALWSSSKNLRAKKELKALLKSDDEKVRIASAMALAELGDMEPGKTVLKRLAEEPTERGRLARALIREYNLKRMIERTQFSGSEKADERFIDPVLDEMRKVIQKYYVDPPKTSFYRLAREAAAGVVAHLDPFSAYLRLETMKRLERVLAGELVGVGLVLSFSPKRKVGEEIRRIPVVVAPLWNGPASLAGVRPMDQVWEIDGKSALDKNLMELKGLLAGKPGSRVTLTLFHKGWFREKKVTLKRARTECPPLLTERLPGGILVAKIPRMTMETGPALLKDLNSARESGVKGVILDLRDNAGGPLEAAVDVAGIFLPKGSSVCSIRGRTPDAAPDREYRTATAGAVKLILVVLTNEGTAESAEILAGALHDNDRCVIVGEETFGRGTVQKRFPLKSLQGKTALELTVARCHLPRTGSFDGKGVRPDRRVPVRRLEIWRYDEINKVLEAGHVKAYLDSRFEANARLFKTLAGADEGKPDRYPGFDEWFKSTGTKAEKDDLRGLLRAAIRRRLSGELGNPMITDLQDDEPLRCAVSVLAKKLGLDLSKIPEYAPFAGKY